MWLFANGRKRVGKLTGLIREGNGQLGMRNGERERKAGNVEVECES
jgi:hypothetical protein